MSVTKISIEGKVLRIGELSKLSGVGIETIRFYERIGLIEEPPRRLSGYREYPRNTVIRLRFIRRTKELGFSLDEIGTFLSLRRASSMKCGDVKKHALKKISDIEGKINDLLKVKEALINLVKTCKLPKSQDCPIVFSLELPSQILTESILNKTQKDRAGL